MSVNNNPPADPNRGVSVGTTPQGQEQFTGVRMQDAVITETTGAGVYTFTASLPAGARIIDIGVQAIALWTAATSATLIVGDDATTNGFFTATDLKATDLLAGESNTIEHPGGLAGAYIVSEQRALYSAQMRNVIFKVTTVGTTGAAGRLHCYVVYAPGSGRSASKV